MSTGRNDRTLVLESVQIKCTIFVLFFVVFPCVALNFVFSFSAKCLHIMVEYFFHVFLLTASIADMFPDATQRKVPSLFYLCVFALPFESIREFFCLLGFLHLLLFVVGSPWVERPRHWASPRRDLEE